MSTIVPGIDVYEGDGHVTWAKVSKAGEKFAFIKVNEGDLIDDRCTLAVRTDIERSGLLVGGYDYLYPRPGRTGAQEFDIFYAHAKKVGLVRKGHSLRCVADVESSGAYNTATLSGRVKTRAYIRSWIKRCLKVTGKYPIIYTGHFWREDLRNPRFNLKYGCPLWLAAYVPESQMGQYIPRAWNGKCSFWQYSETGRVDGVAHAVDRNHYLGSMASLKAHQIL